jgi:hypothetical protein
MLVASYFLQLGCSIFLMLRLYRDSGACLKARVTSQGRLRPGQPSTRGGPSGEQPQGEVS